MTETDVKMEHAGGEPRMNLYRSRLDNQQDKSKKRGGKAQRLRKARGDAAPAGEVEATPVAPRTEHQDLR
jgi:hypothetical protein